MESSENVKRVKYLLESNRDTLWGLTITTVGQQHIAPNMSYPTQNHPDEYLFSPEKGRILDEYQLLYVSRGTGSFVSKSCKKTEIRTGNMFFIFPGEWHSFTPYMETGWDEHWIGFKGVNIDKRYENGFFNLSTPVFDLGYNNEIIALYNLATQTAQIQKAGYQQMLAGIVNYLLGLIYSMDRQSFFDELKITSTIDKAQKIMMDNFQSDISPAEIADTLCLSYSYFRKVFKEYTGYTPKQFLLELRIKKSKELLTATNMYLKEISVAVGFESVEHFCTFFKNNVQMTPIAYRNKTLGPKKLF